MANTVLDHLITALKSAASYNKNVMVAPVAILWPDQGRQWEKGSACPSLSLAGIYLG